MGEFDAAGDLVMGTLLGRAVERPGAHGDDAHDSICLNCGTQLVGPHCHRCGQVGHVHRTIGAIWHEILHGVVHFEGRLWNTLPLLAFRPGELTRRYIHGERAHFVSPMAMFLFSVFTMFAVLQIMGVSPPAEIGSQSQAQALIEQTKQGITDDIRETSEDRAKLPAGSAKARALDVELIKLRRDLADIERIAPTFTTRNTGNVVNFGKTGWYRLDKGIEKANKNPGLALYKLQTNSYKFSWALIPLSIPFVWLLFVWKRQYRGYDHAVFVTYSLSFMSLLFIAGTVAGAIGVGDGWLVLAAFVIPPVHIYFQLKGAYRLRWWSALLRTFILLQLINFIIMLFLLLLLGLGLLG